MFQIPIFIASAHLPLLVSNSSPWLCLCLWLSLVTEPPLNQVSITWRYSTLLRSPPPFWNKMRSDRGGSWQTSRTIADHAYFEAEAMQCQIALVSLANPTGDTTFPINSTSHLKSGEGVAELVPAWLLLDGSSDRRGFDPNAGQVCYGSFLWLPAVAHNCFKKAGAVSDCLWKRAG